MLHPSETLKGTIYLLIGASDPTYNLSNSTRTNSPLFLDVKLFKLDLITYNRMRWNLLRKDYDKENDILSLCWGEDVIL